MAPVPHAPLEEREANAGQPRRARPRFLGAAANTELVKAIAGAYRNQPVEKDAHEVGHATFDAFHAELVKPRQ